MISHHRNQSENGKNVYHISNPMRRRVAVHVCFFSKCPSIQNSFLNSFPLQPLKFLTHLKTKHPTHNHPRIPSPFLILISFLVNSISIILFSTGTFPSSPLSSTSKWSCQQLLSLSVSTAVNPSHPSNVSLLSTGLQFHGPTKCSSASALKPYLISYVSLSTYTQFNCGGSSDIVDT